MSKRFMYAQGADGQIELLSDRVIIHRKGVFNLMKYGPNARREIPLTSVASVNFRDATLFKMGEIDFDYAGRSQLDRKQNTVAFTRKHQEEFYELKEKIFELMQQARK